MPTSMPSPKRPRTLSTGTSSLMLRLSAFLPQMAEANKVLDDMDPECIDKIDDNLGCEASDEDVSFFFDTSSIFFFLEVYFV